jgi:hypothetical protein
MDDKTFERLLKKLQVDDALLHKLVFSPLEAVDELGFIDAVDRDKIAKLSPDAVIQGILTGKGAAADCGVTVQCGSTCTHTSSLEQAIAGRVEAAADCGVTVQCTETCGHTSSLTDKFQMNELTTQIKASIEKQRGRG